MTDTKCHICGIPMNSYGYADTCNTCAADGGASHFADQAAAEEHECYSADLAERGMTTEATKRSRG